MADELAAQPAQVVGLLAAVGLRELEMNQEIIFDLRAANRTGGVDPRLHRIPAPAFPQWHPSTVIALGWQRQPVYSATRILVFAEAKRRSWDSQRISLGCLFWHSC